MAQELGKYILPSFFFPTEPRSHAMMDMHYNIMTEVCFLKTIFFFLAVPLRGHQTQLTTLLPPNLILFNPMPQIILNFIITQQKQQQHGLKIKCTA